MKGELLSLPLPGLPGITLLSSQSGTCAQVLPPLREFQCPPASLQHFQLKRPCWGNCTEPCLPPPFSAPQVRNALTQGPGSRSFQLDSLGAKPALPRNHRNQLLPYEHPRKHNRESTHSKAFNCQEAGRMDYGIQLTLSKAPGSRVAGLLLGGLGPH